MVSVLPARWTEKMKAVVVIFCLFQSVVNVQLVTSFRVYSNLPSVSATSTSYPSSPLSLVTPTSATLSSRAVHCSSGTATVRVAAEIKIPASSAAAAAAAAGVMTTANREAHNTIGLIEKEKETATAATTAKGTRHDDSEISTMSIVAAVGIGIGALPRAAEAAAATIGNTAITSTTYLGYD